MKRGRKLCLGAIWLALWACIGYFLLVLVYCLPVEPMKNHLKNTYKFFSQEGISLIQDNEGMFIDYFTDALMASEAVYDGNQSPWEKAAAVYSNSINDDGEGTLAFQVVKAAIEGSSKFGSYERYWHGNLLYLKPLLYMFEYKDILVLNMLAQLLLMFWIVKLLIQRGVSHLLLPITLAFSMLAPVATALCLQYAPCFYIMSVVCIIVLKYPNFVQKHSGLFFLSVGMATSYFDFLTFPLITLGIPLVLLIVMEKLSWQKRGKKLIKYSICWGMGYTIFWAEKWCIALLVLGCSRLQNIMGALSERSSMEAYGKEISYLQVIYNNTIPFNQPSWKIVFAILCVALLCMVGFRLKQGKKCLYADFNYILPLGMIGCMPLIWYRVAANHSYIHYSFTYREWSITGFAVACIVAELYREWHQGLDKKEG